MSGIQGKVVVITGAASGIGRATALEFARHGANVLIGDIREASATETVEIARELGVRADAVRCDVSVALDLEGLVAHAETEFGGIDVVFGNAGLLRTAPLETLTLEAFEQSLAVNLTANFILAKLTAPILRRRGGGSLIFTASVGGLRGSAGLAAYNASKGGLVNLVRSLADELGPDGIRVNCVCPGWVDTPFNDPFWAYAGEGAINRVVSQVPLRRQSTPEEVAPIVVFLAGDGGTYITGASVVVDGGVFAT